MFSCDIEMNTWMTQYNRYNLSEEFAGGTDFLTITFPASDSGQWNHLYPSWPIVGLVEFQAFAGQVVPTIPEPATMTLLALGGLAVLRRRRK